jgi:hypothetical protein
MNVKYHHPAGEIVPCMFASAAIVVRPSRIISRS